MFSLKKQLTTQQLHTKTKRNYVLKHQPDKQDLFFKSINEQTANRFRLQKTIFSPEINQPFRKAIIPDCEVQGKRERYLLVNQLSNENYQEFPFQQLGSQKTRKDKGQLRTTATSMQIKLKVFLMMSVPMFLMIIIQFAVLLLIYSKSIDLIFDFSEDLYVHQQIQVRQLLAAYSFEFSKVFQRFSETLQTIHNFESKIIRGSVNLHPSFVKQKGNGEKLFQSTEIPYLVELKKKNSDSVTVWQEIQQEQYENSEHKNLGYRQDK